MPGALTFAVELAMLQHYLQLGASSLRLYTNPNTPGKDSVIADFDEATGFGYAPIPLDGGSWQFADAPDVRASYAERAFTFTGALGLIYGYLVMGPDGVLIGAERFEPGPADIKRNGDQLRVTPTVLYP